MKSLVLYGLVVVLVTFALLTRFYGSVHDRVDDYVAIGALVLAVALAAPAQMKQAVQTLRGVLPWKGARDSTAVAQVRIPPEDNG